MSTNNFFNGGKSAPENKSTFALSCNLLSHYFREKGSKACLGDLNHLGFMNGKLESSERPDETSADATATTMDQLLKGDTDKSGQISTLSTNLFPQNMSAYTTVQDAINNLSSLSTSVGEQAAMEPKTAQMTIFYAGQVLVFDDFSAAKAKEVMLLASKGATTTGFDSITNINKIVDNCGNNMPSSSSCNLYKIVDYCGNNMPSSTSSCNLSNSGPIRVESETRPQSQPIGSDLPIARRASLHRFLEKRKDRTTARAPYQIHNPSPESSPKEQFDLNL